MSDKSLINQLKNTVLKDSWLSDMYGTKKAEQQSELKRIFTQVQTEEYTSEEKSALLAKKETLEETVERLEAKMAVLAEELDKNQNSIDEASSKIVDIVANIESKSELLATKQKDWATNVVKDVMAAYKRGIISGYDEMVYEMSARMKRFSDGGLSSQIQACLSNMQSKKREITELCACTINLLTQRNNLESQYGVTKTTYKFLTAAISNANKSTAYTNSDYNSILPVYSPDKLELTGNLFKNSNLNVSAGVNSSYESGASKPTLDSIKEKYKEFMGIETGGSDKYKYDNPAIQGLGNAIDNGLLNDLNTANVRGEDLVNFLSENFAGARVIKNNDGGLKIPYGHDAQSREIFNKLSDFVATTSLSDDANSWKTASFSGALNTWNSDLGNTISTNNQIKVLADNYSDIFSQFKNGNFTFKEAMYALFNPESGLFKDCGISYNLNEQNGKSVYNMDYAGDSQTAELYKNIAVEIYNIWGVKPSRPGDSDISINRDESETANTTPVRTDPLSFRDSDGTEYSFITDRNQNGKFDSKEEFVGGSASLNWLSDLASLDADGNGVIEGDELNNLGLFGQKYNEETKIKPEQTTNVNYVMKTAKDAGIEKIDLTEFMKFNETTGKYELDENLEKVNNSTGNFDLNGSEEFNDKFNFTMNGQTYEAKRKDETDEFMNTIYKDAYGLKMDGNIGLEEAYVDSTIDETYGEFDTFASRYKNITDKINVVNNIDGIYDQTKQNSEQTIARGNDEANIIIRQGQNSSEAQYNNKSDWSSIKESVINEASKLGISITDSFLEQTKGIYVLKGGTAQSIVAEYHEMMQQQESDELHDKNSEEAWSAIIECTKCGVDATIEQIFDKLNSGSATTAKEVAQQLAEELGTTQFTFTPNAEDKNKYENALAASIKEFEARENELYTAFNTVFANANAKDKVVVGLYQLVQEQMKDATFMQNKTGEELANIILNKIS